MIRQCLLIAVMSFGIRGSASTAINVRLTTILIRTLLLVPSLRALGKETGLLVVHHQNAEAYRLLANLHLLATNGGNLDPARRATSAVFGQVLLACIGKQAGVLWVVIALSRTARI